jgi:hypothetical protein
MSRTLRYYKSADPLVCQAFVADMNEATALQNEAQAFADRFRAVAVFTQGFAPGFVGVTFTKEKPCPIPGIWEHRQGNGPLWNLRRRAVKPSQDELLKTAKQTWVEHFPSHLVPHRLSKTLTAMGLEDSDMQGQALAVEVHNGVLYIVTTFRLHTLSEVAYTELTGSQYEEATKPVIEVLPPGESPPVNELPTAAND